MDPANLQDELSKYIKDMLSLDPFQQHTAIESIYDIDAQLVNPFLVLHGRDEIISSYKTLSTSNLNIQIEIDSICNYTLNDCIAYDQIQQIAMIDLRQHLLPKALGGLMTISTHQILKLQLESDAKGKLWIVHHSEIHSTQGILNE